MSEVSILPKILFSDKCSTATVHSTSRPVSQIFTFLVTLFDPVFTTIKMNTKCSTCIHQLQQSFCTQHYNRKIFSMLVPGDAFSLLHFLELPILRIYQRHGWLIFWTVRCKLPARKRRWENNDNSKCFNVDFGQKNNCQHKIITQNYIKWKTVDRV